MVRGSGVYGEGYARYPRRSSLPVAMDYGRLSTRERDPGNKLVRRMSGAEPAARRGSGELSGEQRRVCIFAINKRIFKSFLL